MDVYLFLSGSAWHLRAFTSDQSGANLPAEYGPWTPANGGKVMLEAADPIAGLCPRMDSPSWRQTWSPRTAH